MSSTGDSSSGRKSPGGKRLQLQAFFETLNKEYDQEIAMREEEKGGVLDDVEEQTILGDSEFPFIGRELESSSSSCSRSDQDFDVSSESEPDNSSFNLPESREDQDQQKTPNTKRRRNSASDTTSNKPLDLSDSLSSTPNLSSSTYKKNSKSNFDSPNLGNRDRQASSSFDVPKTSSDNSSSFSNQNSNQSSNQNSNHNSNYNSNNSTPSSRPKINSRAQTMIDAASTNTSQSTTSNGTQTKQKPSVGSLKSFWEKLGATNKEEADRLKVVPKKGSSPSVLPKERSSQYNIGSPIHLDGIRDDRNRSQTSSIQLTSNDQQKFDTPPTSPSRIRMDPKMENEHTQNIGNGNLNDSNQQKSNQNIDQNVDENHSATSPNQQDAQKSEHVVSTHPTDHVLDSKGSLSRENLATSNENNDDQNSTCISIMDTSTDSSTALTTATSSLQTNGSLPSSPKQSGKSSRKMINAQLSNELAHSSSDNEGNSNSGSSTAITSTTQDANTMISVSKKAAAERKHSYSPRSPQTERRLSSHVDNSSPIDTSSNHVGIAASAPVTVSPIAAMGLEDDTATDSDSGAPSSKSKKRSKKDKESSNYMSSESPNSTPDSKDKRKKKSSRTNSDIVVVTSSNGRDQDSKDVERDESSTPSSATATPTLTTRDKKSSKKSKNGDLEDSSSSNKKSKGKDKEKDKDKDKKKKKIKTSSKTKKMGEQDSTPPSPTTSPKTSKVSSPSTKKALSVANVQPAAEVTSATGKIDIDKLKHFFASWDVNDMSHSWEINPLEIEFVENIGEGTSCSVYRGTYRGQVVALKVLKDINQKQLTNFVKEFDIMSDFRSPYVVFFFGACIQPLPVMVLGYCHRGSLYHVLNQKDITITWPIVIKVCLATLRGLDSMHKWKPQIVHRDLKSRNILVEDDWSTKLCDFGESRYTTGTNLETLCKVRGTYAYIAPEVYFGQTFTTKSDVYAFGVILWELCTKCQRGVYSTPYGEFKSLTYDFQIIVLASRKGLRPTIDPGIPEALSNLIQLCWDHEPENRPETGQLLKFFEEISTMDPNNPKAWLKTKSYLPWPPASGPGKAGAPPRPHVPTPSTNVQK